MDSREEQLQELRFSVREIRVTRKWLQSYERLAEELFPRQLSYQIEAPVQIGANERCISEMAD